MGSIKVAKTTVGKAMMNTDTNTAVARRLHRITEYYFVHKLREVEILKKEGRDILMLGIGSPDMPPHPTVIAALNDASSNPYAHRYQPYRGLPTVREAMSTWYEQWYGVVLNPATEVLPLMGSKEGIVHLCLAFVNEGDRVLVPNPGYPTYRSAVHLAGGECVEYALDEQHQWYPNMEELERIAANPAKRKVAMMWVNYPHMPTGQASTPELFEVLVAFGRKHNILVCHDNPYSFILNDTPASILQIEGAKECAVELNSLSKSHNMAGWRVGMLLGAQERLDTVLRCKSNMDSGMFFPIQQAVGVALSLGREWYANLNAVYAERKELLCDILHAVGCSFDKQCMGMFAWAKVPERYANGEAFANDLLHHMGVFVVPGSVFGSAGKHYVRASLCCPTEQLLMAHQRITKGGTL